MVFDSPTFQELERPVTRKEGEMEMDPVRALSRHNGGRTEISKEAQVTWQKGENLNLLNDFKMRLTDSGSNNTLKYSLRSGFLVIFVVTSQKKKSPEEANGFR
jgi:hypothetical protein